MDSSTKWFVIGLRSFTLGSIILAGYFLTPGYDPDDDNNKGLCHFSDKYNALPFGVSLTVFGFLVVLVNLCCCK